MNNTPASECDRSGTKPTRFDRKSGECFCRENISGINCEKSAPGYYNFPDIKGNILSKFTCGSRIQTISYYRMHV